MPNAHTAEPLLTVRGKRLAALMQAAKTRPVEVLVLGSSLHTMSGNGRMLCTAINRAAADFYGGTPGTPWMPIASFNSGPPGQWCSRSARQTAMVTVSGLVASYAPPDFTPMRATNGTYGHLLMLDNDNAGACMGEFTEPGEFLPLGSSFAAKFVAWSKGQATSEATLSANMYWQLLKSARPSTPNFLSTQVALQSSIALPTPNAFGGAGVFDPNNAVHQAAQLWCPSAAGGAATVHAQDAANPLLQMHWKGADANGFIMAGVRWDHASAPFGMRFHFSGAGGYHSTSLLDSHSNSMPTLQAMGPFDIIIVCYHTNSAYTANKNAATYKSDTAACLDWLRAGFPDAVIGLKGDGYRDGGNSTQDTNFSEMVGAQHDLVRDGSPAEFAINTTLATQRSGFNSRSHTLTGKTFKGKYNNATSYVIGDVASIDVNDQTQYVECVYPTGTNDTNTVPLKNLNGGVSYWRRYRRWLLANGDATAAPSDNVHLSAYGDLRMAETDFKLMLSALSGKSTSVLRAAR